MSKRVILDRIAEAINRIENIRNISVIAHVDHGKSTLTDALICRAGLISKDRAGTARFMDSRPDEQERTITIKSSSVSMVFDVPVRIKNKPIDPDWQLKKAAKAQGQAQAQGQTQAPAQDPAAPAAGAAAAAAAVPAAAPVPAPAPVPAVADNKQPAAAAAAAADKKQSGAGAGAGSGYVTEPILVNLIDSPGHVDFSSEVTAALRLSDGALVVVDCIESVCVQTRTVLRQALQERVKPVLFLNKMDRLFLELRMPLEEMYQSLARTIESANVVIAMYADERLGDVTVWPQNGSVGFGSGLHGWAFTLQSFARLYHDKFGISEKKMMKKLWGDHFYDPKLKRWSTSQYDESGKKLERGFCMLVLAPLKKLFDSIMAQPKADPNTYMPMIAKLTLSTPLSKDDLATTGKELMKKVMQSWLPAADALTAMIAEHLPSPVTAQKYRVESLYSGPMDDACATAIRTCDPNGPLMMYVSKMIPTNDGSRFYAFGRVFSGTLRVGATVRMQGPDYIPELAALGKADAKEGAAAASTSTSTKAKSDLHVKPITGACLMMGPMTENMASFGPGMMCGLIGVDQYLLKSGTITTHAQAHNFHTLKFSVSPIVRCAVTTVEPQHLPKLQVGLKRLMKADPLVQVVTSASGESIVAGCGELHLEICLKDLREDFMKGVALKVSDPVVSYCETVTAPSTQEIVTKSPSGLNRIKIKAQPLGDKFCRAVDSGDILPLTSQSQSVEAKAQARRFVEDYGWELNEAKKVWSFGLGEGVANVLVDASKAVPYLPEARDVVCSGWREAAAVGVLCGETLRGVRFDIVDAKLHSDQPHRGPRQLNPMMQQAISGIQLASAPRLLEPMYQCDIVVPSAASAGVYATLRARRAQVVDLDGNGHGSAADAKNGDLMHITAHLPVCESFGFAALLRKNTSGQAFPQLLFSHWAVMPGDPLDPTSTAGKTVAEIRARKGMKGVLPKFEDFHVKGV